jgi:hypothetical protein
MHNTYVPMESPIMTTDDLGPNTGWKSTLSTSETMCFNGAAMLSFEEVRR